MIKQRDWGNSCGGELGISLPLNAAVSAMKRKDKRETKAARIKESSLCPPREAQPRDTTLAIRADIYCTSKVTFTVTACWFTLTLTMNKPYKLVIMDTP